MKLFLIALVPLLLTPAPPAREREESKQEGRGTSSGGGRGSEERRQDDDRRGGGDIIIFSPPGGDPYPYPTRTRREMSVTFERDGQLWEVALMGNARPNLVRGVPASGARQPARSPAWGRLAFVSEPGNLAWITAEGRKLRTLTSEKWGRIAQPTWSPDDKTLAFVSDRDGNDEIYLVGEKGGKPRRITSHPASDTSPALSSDGHSLYFVSDRDGIPTLFVQNLHQRLPNAVAVGVLPPGAVVSVATARSSPSLVVCVSEPGGKQIYLVSPLGRTEPRKISDGRGDDDQPCLSPDGTRVAFRTTEKGASSLVLWDRATGRAERLTDGPTDSHPTLW